MERHMRSVVVLVGEKHRDIEAGIAAILISRCLEALDKDGKKVVILHVNQNNSDAISLYEQLGFKTVRIRGTFEKLS